MGVQTMKSSWLHLTARKFLRSMTAISKGSSNIFASKRLRFTKEKAQMVFPFPFFLACQVLDTFPWVLVLDIKLFSSDGRLTSFPRSYSIAPILMALICNKQCSSQHTAAFRRFKYRDTTADKWALPGKFSRFISSCNWTVVTLIEDIILLACCTIVPAIRRGGFPVEKRHRNALAWTHPLDGHEMKYGNLEDANSLHYTTASDIVTTRVIVAICFLLSSRHNGGRPTTAILLLLTCNSLLLPNLAVAMTSDGSIKSDSHHCHSGCHYTVGHSRNLPKIRTGTNCIGSFSFATTMSRRSTKFNRYDCA